MNAVLIALIGALLVWAAWRTIRRARRGSVCCGEREADVARVKSRARSAQLPYETTLAIGGMTCENCARRVENALNALPDTRARVDIATKTARVRTKTPPNVEQLRQTVRGAGYVVLEQK